MAEQNEGANGIGEAELLGHLENENLLKDLQEVVQSLPSNAVKDLLSLGICVRCIFWLFGVQGRIYVCSLLSSSMLSFILGGPTDLGKDMVDNGFKKCENSVSSKEIKFEPQLCGLCLGILQFKFFYDREMLVKTDSVDDIAVLIADLVKQEGRHVDSFSLEVSLPLIILENDHSVRSYMKMKYGSEPSFQEKLHTGCIATKDALKFSLVYPLENLLDCKS